MARTLAVLSFDFRGFQDEKRYATALPRPTEVAVFARYEAFYQFLVKATAVGPDGSVPVGAGEMAEQLLGVLRQVVALDGGESAARPQHELQRGTRSGRAPGQLARSSGSGGGSIRPGRRAPGRGGGLRAPIRCTPSWRRRPARRSWCSAWPDLLAEEGRFAEAMAELEAAPTGPGAWRVAWWRGVVHLAAGRAGDAEPFFSVVSAELPGELAPRLAMAVALESAAAGGGDRSPAVGVTIAPDLEDTMPRPVDPTSWWRPPTRRSPVPASGCHGSVRRRVTGPGRRCSRPHPGHLQLATSKPRSPRSASAPPTWPAAHRARRSRSALPHHRGSDRRVVGPAARWSATYSIRPCILLLDQRVDPDPDVALAGAPSTRTTSAGDWRRTYRSLAKLAPTDEERFRLVDLANANRPRTLT